MEDMIKTQNLIYSYDEEDDEGEGTFNVVLDNISLNIHKGEFVAILGHNGCGKSTLAKHFNAILLPHSGKVYVKDMDTSDEKHIYDIRQNVGMVFQNPDNQIVSSIVEEDVAFAPENLGVPPQQIAERVYNALETVGMTDYAKSSPHMLSGGQKQRIAIAGVLAMMPSCIVLDEPTAMLDPKGREEVISTVKRLNKEQKMTVVLITHYMDEASQADRVIVMERGSVIMDDVPKKVFSQVETLKEARLDVPQVTQLAYELRKCGIDIASDIISVDECADEIIRLIGKKQNN